MLTESALFLGRRGSLVSLSVDPPTYLHSLLYSPSFASSFFFLLLLHKFPLLPQFLLLPLPHPHPSPPIIISFTNFRIRIEYRGPFRTTSPGYFYSRMFCIVFHNSSSSSASCYPIPSCCAFAKPAQSDVVECRVRSNGFEDFLCIALIEDKRL